MSEFSTKNYMAHGGAELVIGGKLTFLPGSTVEGAEKLLAGVQSKAPLPAIEDSKASTVAALREDHNRLLAALRAAGLMPDGSAQT